LRQFNVVVSEPEALRGVHLHFDHTDHLIMVHGQAVIGLHDCRLHSPTFRSSATVILSNGDRLLSIPPGVAHGFWMPDGGTLVYGLDTEWTPADELGCAWDDPDLAIDWSPHGGRSPLDVAGGPNLSDRDRDAGPLRVMLDRFNLDPHDRRSAVGTDD
jgi:dTDP-4-dehydrorhamnose 3,5-epimerase